jgi:hypothetical protein
MDEDSSHSLIFRYGSVDQTNDVALTQGVEVTAQLRGAWGRDRLRGVNKHILILVLILEYENQDEDEGREGKG